MNDLFRKDLLRKFGPDRLARIERAQIGIAGAGGLGSNCAACLVRSGFRRLVIADYDKVDAANLDRQFYFEDQIGQTKVDALRANLLRINPSLEMEALALKLDSGNVAATFRSCDVIVECLDQAEAKSMLVTRLLPSGKLIVAASGLGGYGASDAIRIHRPKKNLVIVGDLASDIEKTPAIAPRVMVAAAKQADLVLEYIAEGRHERQD